MDPVLRAMLQFGSTRLLHDSVAYLGGGGLVRGPPFSRTAVIFRLDALALSVIATATWLAGWVAVRHSRYCIKTTKRI